MTRSLYLANTSNGDGENFVVELVANEPGFDEKRLLKPGEKMFIPAYVQGVQYTIMVEPTLWRDDDGEFRHPQAFINAEGEQTLPNAEVVWTNGEPVKQEAR